MLCVCVCYVVCVCVCVCPSLLLIPLTPLSLSSQGQRHNEHIAVYGKGNELRLTGKHETASIHTWKYGVADRGESSLSHTHFHLTHTCASQSLDLLHPASH